MIDSLVAELRACAFCKANVPQVYASLHHVHCNVCGAVAPKQSWNTRAADALEPSGDVVERVARAILQAHALDTIGLGQNTVDAVADHAWQSWIPEATAALSAMQDAKVVMVRAEGQSVGEMRRTFLDSEEGRSMYQKGDTILVWINAADLPMPALGASHAE